MKLLLALILAFAMTFPSFAASPNQIKLEKGSFVILDKPFDDTSTANVMAEVNNILFNPLYKSKSIIPPFAKKKRVIYLILSTPGGGVVSGLTMFDYLNALDIEVKTITLFAASMGFHAAQFLGERLITPSGTLMTHKARGGFQGEFQAGNSQIDSRKNYWERRIKRMDTVTVQRTKGKINLKEYRKLMENEYWCEGQDCVNKGFADRVVRVSCGESLAGSEIVEELYYFMGMQIKLKLKVSNCPFIGPMAVQLKYDKKGFLDINSPLVDPTLRKFVKEKMSNKEIK